MSGIEKLKGYSYIIRNWKITNGHMKDCLLMIRVLSSIMILHMTLKITSMARREIFKRFDHDQFAADCDRYVARQMISYNSTQMVKDRFQDWLACTYDLTYTMRSTGDYMNEQKDR